METPTDCGTKAHPPRVMSLGLLWLLSKSRDGRLMMDLDFLRTIHGVLVEKTKGVMLMERRLFGPIHETAPDRGCVKTSWYGAN